MDLPEFFTTTIDLSDDDQPSKSVPCVDHNADELPFNALGGPRFEVLAYLLENAEAGDEHDVVLFQASGDKGRDVVVYMHGVLARVIQCKNLVKKIGPLDILTELVKLLLFDELKSFLPLTPIRYEMWAPGGFSEPAYTLLAEWPKTIKQSDVETALLRVVSTYKTLAHFEWAKVGPKLQERLKTQFTTKREDGITLSQRVRANRSVYQRFFLAIQVLSVAATEQLFETRLIPKVLEAIRGTAEQDKAAVPTAIDLEIDEAAGCINGSRFQDAESLLKRLQEKHEAQFTARQRFRVVSNLATALFRLGRSEEAARLYQEAAALEPDDERASTNQVLAHLLLGQDSLAFELAAERRKRYPDNGRLLAIWIATAPREMPISTLRDAVTELFQADPEVNVAFSRKLLLAGDLADATECAARAQRAAPDWPQTYLLQAHCAIGQLLLPPPVQKSHLQKRSQVMDEGIIAAGKAQELSAAQADRQVQAQALAARTELYLLAGDQKAAIADARQAYKLNPEDVGNVLMLAQTQLVENQIEVGVATLEEALNLEQRPDVCLMLSRALRARNKTGDRERSVELIINLATADLPDLMRPPVAIGVMQVLGSEKEFERAAGYLANERDALDSVTRQSLEAYIVHEQGQKDQAQALLSSALAELEPMTHPFTREFLARMLMTVGRPAEALPLYEELFSYETANFDVAQLIQCAGTLQRDQLVLETFDELHRRSAVEWELLEAEIFYLRKYHVAKAIDRLTAFLVRRPEHRLARLTRSALAWETGQNHLIESRMGELPSISDLPLSYISIALKMIALGENANQVVDYAYRFLKLHFNEAEAHSAFISCTLLLRTDKEADPNLLIVGEDAAVHYREMPDGPEHWTVLVTTDAPDLHFEERSMDDDIARELLGKKVGDEFVLAPGLRNRVGKILQILPKYVRRFQDSMSEMAIRFPAKSNSFQVIRIGGPDEIDSGLSTVFEGVRLHAEQIEDVRRLYVTQPIPIHLFAERLRKNAYEAMIEFAFRIDMEIKCCNGDPQALSSAIQVLEGAKNIVLDLTSIATLRLLGLEGLLSAETFVISQDTLSELRQTLLEETPDGEHGVMNYEDGRFRMDVESAEQKGRRSATDKAFYEHIVKNTSMKPHLSLASMEASQRDTLTKFFAQYGVEAMSLGAEPDSVLLSDDAIQGEAMASLFHARRSWTQAFLIVCVKRGKLSYEHYYEAVAKLVGMRYQGTTFDSSTLLHAAKLAGYDANSWPFKQATAAFSVIGTPIQALIEIALAFHRLLLREPVLPQQSGGLLSAILEALWQNPNARRRLLQVRSESFHIFGVNVIAATQFNMCFDHWYSEHANDIL